MSDRKKKILINIILIFILAALGVLAYFAIHFKWFEDGAKRSSLNDSASSIDNPVFPEAHFEENEASNSTVESFPNLVPDYIGEDIVIISDDRPNFTMYDLEHISGEIYSELDSLGRCGSAIAMLDYSMMPTEKRGDIGDIKPSGWKQEKYPGIVNSDPPYLYNRCHLIAYMFTGQNANPKNLITGTRYFNSELMLKYENQVADYLYDSEHPNLDGTFDHVLYRVTPYFKGDESVARGVEMEALSVEDNGKSLCFHVFIYNVQPGIEIDYKTGESRVAD